MEKLSKDNIPKHIAIIMDGNRRWAKARGLPSIMGHKRVVDRVLEPLVERAAELGVEQMSFWAWSTENWKRDKREVWAIMKLFKWALGKYGDKLIEKGARVRVIGDIGAFNDEIRGEVERVVKESEKNKKITLVFGLNYGGRDELLRAVSKLIEERQKAKGKRQRIIEEDFSKYLDTAGMRDPDLIIRTSGEQRLSGFMPWQSVYSELYFPEVLMPDFTVEELERAIEEFQKRKRRYGR